jgi:hypothetical protein
MTELMTELYSGPTKDGDLLVVVVTNPDARQANDANRKNFMTDLVIQRQDLTVSSFPFTVSSSLYVFFFTNEDGGDTCDAMRWMVAGKTRLEFYGD